MQTITFECINFQHEDTKEVKRQPILLSIIYPAIPVRQTIWREIFGGFFFLLPKFERNCRCEKSFHENRVILVISDKITSLPKIRLAELDHQSISDFNPQNK